jgi:flagellar assembly protein FliH
MRPGDRRLVEPVNWPSVPGGECGALFRPLLTGITVGGGSEFEKQLEQSLRDARAAAFREGESAGQSRAEAELRPVLERLARSIDEIGSLRARLRREAEKDLVRLALAIARRILRRELAVDPDALHGLVLGALEKLQSQEIARVRVHPAQAPVVEACLREHTGGTQVEVIADSSREPGAVIFETSCGNLDASVESQLREIERGLAERLQPNS